MRSRHASILIALIALATAFGTARASIIDCTVRDIQDTSSVLWDTLVTSGTTPDTLRTTGVVTGADTKTTGFGFYIEDFGLAAQYRGLDIFTGGHNSYVESSLVRGQRVRCTGRVAEFSGGTELVSMNGGSFGDSLRIEHNLGNPGIPGPTIVTTADISEASAIGEQYEGMFVRLNHSIRCTDLTGWPTAPLPFRSWRGVDNTAVGVTDTILVDMETLADPGINPPPVGSVITFLQGIVDQRGIPSGTQPRGYRLQVRDGGDALLPTPPSLLDAYAISADSIRMVFDKALDPVTAQNVANYSRSTFKAIDSATLMPSPSSGVPQLVDLACISDPMTPAEAESVVASGVKSSLGVVMAAPSGQAFLAGLTPIVAVQTPITPFNGPAGTDSTQYAGKTLTIRGTVTGRFGTLVWIQDAAGGLRSGLKLFAPSSGMDVGDDVIVAGIPLEFFDETEFSGAFFERTVGAGVMPPAIDIAATGLDALNDTIPAGGTNEVYEGVLLRIHDVGIEDSNVGFGEFLAKRGGPCFIDPSCDDTVHVDDRGAGSYTYEVHTGNQLASVTGPVEISFLTLKLEPRTDADFVPGAVTGADPLAGKLALRASGANPVQFARGSAQFAITLPAQGMPVLALYDLRGRLVNTLLSGRVVPAGPLAVEWKGTDAAGRRVSSGIYFAQLRLGNQVALTKVVVAN